MKRYALLLLISLSACSSRMIVRRGDGDAYAPTNEKRGGVMSYSLNAYRNGSRQVAYKKMSEYCAGPYRILKEGSTNGGMTAVSTYASGAVFTNYSKDPDHWRIEFECETQAEHKP